MPDEHEKDVQPRPRHRRLMEQAMKRARRWVRPWFRWRCSGVEHIPAEGPALLVGNHSGGFNRYDGLMTMLAVWERFGPERELYFLGHDALFATRGLARWARRMGVLRADHRSAENAFAQGHLVVVYPGGDLDTFRSFRDRNRIELGGRQGFVRLALRAQVPIIPVVIAGLQESLVILDRGDRLARRLGVRDLIRSRVAPIGFSLPWGFGLTVLPHLPLPVQVSQRFGKPLILDNPPADADDPAVTEKIYRRIHHTMQSMMDELCRGRIPFLGKLDRHSR